jgi:hypothetical protein
MEVTSNPCPSKLYRSRYFWCPFRRENYLKYITIAQESGSKTPTALEKKHMATCNLWNIPRVFSAVFTAFDWRNTPFTEINGSEMTFLWTANATKTTNTGTTNYMHVIGKYMVAFLPRKVHFKQDNILYSQSSQDSSYYSQLEPLKIFPHFGSWFDDRIGGWISHST